jgi:hypothetical protein
MSHYLVTRPLVSVEALEHTLMAIVAAANKRKAKANVVVVVVVVDAVCELRVRGPEPPALEWSRRTLRLQQKFGQW